MTAAGVDRTLAVLAVPCRRQVVDLLRERPRRAGELADATGTPFPAMSRHLRALREGGLVEEQRDEFDSRVRVYRLRPEPLAELTAWLGHTDAMWARQLRAFKAHVRKAKP